MATINMNKLFTIGVYGSTVTGFFNKLIDNNIDTFCDIRRRRGVRGTKYSFVNSKRLQNKLIELTIAYYHFIDLSPTKEIREKQKEEDKRLNTLKRERTLLDDVFINSFIEEHLTDDNISEFINTLGSKAKNVVLFCVEQQADACHRSLVAKKLAEQNPTIEIIHL